MRRLPSCPNTAAVALLQACRSTWGVAVLVALLTVGIHPAWAQSAGSKSAESQPAEYDDFDAEALQPGLVASFRALADRAPGDSGRAQRGERGQPERIDDQLSFTWPEQAADSRVSGGPFLAEWTGQLFARPSGNFRLHLFVQGKVEVELDGQAVLTADADQPGWVSSDELRLAVGYHLLRVTYEKTQENGRLGLYWSGPAFALEPVPATALWHAESDDSQRAAAIHRGAELVDALRCVACHDLPGTPPLLPAPSLQHVRGNVEPGWLIDVLHTELGNPEPESGTPGDESTAAEEALHRHVPDFGFDRQTAVNVAAALLDASADAPKKQRESHRASESKKDKQGDSKESPPDALRGEQIMVTVGCLACHVYEDLGHSGPLGGGDLTEIAVKHPADFFERWIQDPASVNPQHRMPVFDLTPDERQDLAAFLQGLGGTLDDDSASPHPRGQGAETADPADPALAAKRNISEADLAAGRDVIGRTGCVACHSLPASLPKTAPARIPVSASSDWQRSCLDSPSNATSQPDYRLTEADAAAIRQYVESRFGTKPQNEVLAADLLRRSQCLACHPRGAGAGNSDAALAIASRYADVVAHVAALTPPSLNSLGDKLRDEPLRKAIAGKADARRPWLSVRMPRFPLTETEVDELATAFITADRIPADAPELPAVAEALPEATLRTVGGRLVTSNGFGCTSCHAIGDVQPGEAPISSLGPNLSELGQRVRPEWFRRWVANPLRIVPRVEMPAIVTPVSGVLDDHLDQQVGAVWHVLNLPDFHPPKPNPVRSVQKRGLASAEEPAAVITDVLYSDGRERIKPLLIGLPNRQNVLFDLEEARIDAWWSGDAAYQRTEGKRWFWETPGGDLWPTIEDPESPSPPGAASEWSLVPQKGAAAESLEPQRVGQFRTEVDCWQHLDGGGVQFTHRLHFKVPSSDSPSGDDAPAGPLATVVVEQTLRPLWSSTGSGVAGWERQIRTDLLPEGWRLMHRPLPIVDSPDPANAPPAVDDRTVSGTGASGARIQVVATGDSRLNSQGWVGVPESDLSGEHAAQEKGKRLTLEYSADVPVDEYPPLPRQEAVETAADLQVVPGFSAHQLPLPQEMMPTAFSWHPDGSLYVTDLKGPVWRASDSDGDGQLDRATKFCDFLATPFGIAAHEDYVDVVNKYALLRLWDESGDGVADRVETLASGWGHTADYHDWAVGLPQTEEGGYYVTLACQQDQRSRAAANLRGSVIHLDPRQPTPENPHRFDIRRVTSGHRFPIGIAQSSSGEVFVSDNQGNYKPFNELNHIVEGANFGFINLLDRQAETQPERTPPSIEIPHPWTRSVNGICFLTTPAEATKPSRFGPFEGHLVGCEYDTRRLVRMSLQRVGDQFQGAVYPFSYNTPPAGPPLLGPISCGVSPAGELFVGNLRESGWGAGANIGNLVQFRFQPEELPAGIAEIRATSRGFEMELTRQVDPSKARDSASYSIASYTRVSTPRYGGDDQQRRAERIRSVEYDPQRLLVVVELEEMRKDFVYEFEVASLVPEGEPFYPDEAFYTLRELVPADSEGN